MRLFYGLSMVFLLILAGCVYKTESDLSNRVSLTFHEPIDMDYDGTPDASYMLYSPARIEGAGFSLSVGRAIYVYPTDYVVEPRRDTVDADTISFIKANLASLKNEIDKADASCKARVSFSICNDEASCESACFTDVCEEEGLGYLLLDYRKLADERDELLRTSTFLAASLREGDSIKELSTALTELQVVLATMSNHPLVRDVGFCSFEADVGSLISQTGFISPSKSKALVVTYVEGEPQDGSAVELSLKEAIDPNIESNIEKFDFSPQVKRESRRPTVLIFSPFKLADKPLTFYYTYAAEGALRQDNTPFALWKSLTSEIRIVALQLGGLEQKLAFIDSIYKTMLPYTVFPAFTVGLALGVVWLGLVFIYEAALYLFRLVVLLRAKRPLPYALRRAFGYASTSWNVDALIAIVLFIVAFGVEAYVLPPVSIASLTLEDVSVAFQAVPLSGIVMFISLVGAFFFSSFFVDRVKRLFAGKAYDEEREVPTPEKNLALWKQLRDAIDNAKDELDEISKKEMDVSQQLSELLSIPIEKLREDIYSNPDQYKVRDELRKSLEKVSSILEGVHHKSELAKENRARWIAYIKKKMASSERLPLDALISIPIEWRFWAVKEYLKEHPEDFVELEGTMLVKKKASEEERARSFLEKLMAGERGKFFAAAVVSRKRLLAFNTASDSPTYMANILLMISNRLDELGSSTSLSKFESYVVYTKTFNSKRVIVIASSSVLEVASERIEKFSAML